MIRTPTTFVFGAGAGCELQLPSGPELTQRIAQCLDFDRFVGDLQTRDSLVLGQYLSKMAARMQKSDEQVRAAADRIRIAAKMASSIDETATYYLTPSELAGKVQANPRFVKNGVKVGARVVSGTIVRDPGGRELTFQMTDGTRTYPVHYRGIAPDTFTDGVDIVVTANTERMWLDLCRALGLADLVTDPRFATSALRLTHRTELWAVLEPRFRERDSVHWIAGLSAVSIPVGPVLNLCSALGSPQAADRGMVAAMHSAAGSTVRVPGDPLKMAAPSRAPSYPPHLGEHTEHTLSQWLGLDEAALQVLRNQGVVHQFQPGLSAGPTD